MECWDSTVRLQSLVPGEGSLLEQRSRTAPETARPHSVALAGGTDRDPGEIALTVGLDDGLALRAAVDPVTGAVGTSPSRRFLGARPVAVYRVLLWGALAKLLFSS